MRVGPVGLPGRDSWEVWPPSPARAPGTGMAPPLPDRARKLILTATFGAGSRRKMATAATVRAATVVPSPRPEIRPPLLADDHNSTRPQRPKADQISTYTP